MNETLFSKAAVLKEIDEATEALGLSPSASEIEDSAYWHGRVDALHSLRTEIWSMQD